MTEHTPTPWRLQDGRVQGPAKYNIGGYVDIARCEQFFHERDHLRSIAPNVAECAANAAFIVKAVNSHNALIDALETACEYLESEDDFHPAFRLREKFLGILSSVGGPGL